MFLCKYKISQSVLNKCPWCCNWGKETHWMPASENETFPESVLFKKLSKTHLTQFVVWIKTSPEITNIIKTGDSGRRIKVYREYIFPTELYWYWSMMLQQMWFCSRVQKSSYGLQLTETTWKKIDLYPSVCIFVSKKIFVCSKWSFMWLCYILLLNRCNHTCLRCTCAQ